jgi:hypothetical protein
LNIWLWLGEQVVAVVKYLARALVAVALEDTALLLLVNLLVVVALLNLQLLSPPVPLIQLPLVLVALVALAVAQRQVEPLETIQFLVQ